MPHAVFDLVSSAQCQILNHKIKETKIQIPSTTLASLWEPTTGARFSKMKMLLCRHCLPQTHPFLACKVSVSQRVIDTIICLIWECQAGLFHRHSVKHGLKNKKHLSVLFSLFHVLTPKEKENNLLWVKFTISKQKTGSLSKYRNRGKGDLFPEFQQMSYLIGCEINQSYSRPASLVSAVKTLSNMCISLLLLIMRVWGENQTSKRGKAARMLHAGLQIH